MVGGGDSTWLEGAIQRRVRGRFDVVGKGVSTWFEGALGRG